MTQMVSVMLRRRGSAWGRLVKDFPYGETISRVLLTLVRVSSFACQLGSEEALFDITLAPLSVPAAFMSRTTEGGNGRGAFSPSALEPSLL